MANNVNIEALVKAQHYNEVLGRNVGLESQVQQLKERNRQLMKRVRESSKPWQDIHQALEDATLLLSLHAADLPTSRRYCANMGIMTERRWNRAWKLLRIAQAAEHSGIVDRPQADNIERLNQAFEDFRTHPKAFRRSIRAFGVVTPAPRKRHQVLVTNPRQTVTDSTGRGLNGHAPKGDRRAEIEARHVRGQR